MNILTANLAPHVANYESTSRQISIRDSSPLAYSSFSSDELRVSLECGEIWGASTKNLTFEKFGSITMTNNSNMYNSADDNGNFAAMVEKDPVFLASPKHKKQSTSSFDFLRETLQTNKTLKKLSAIGSSSEGWNALCEGLNLNSSIEDVTFGDGVFGQVIELESDACYNISQLLAKSTKIKKLTLRGLSLLKENAEILSDGIAKNSSIQTMQLFQIETDYFDLLFDAISRNSSIKTLSVNDCDIEIKEDYDSEDDYGSDEASNTIFMHPLETLVRNTSKIAVLKITDCLLGFDEIPALCNGLKYNASIKYLDLSGNDLLSDCCESLANMLKTNTHLQHLVLEDNIIGDRGLLQLCPGLKKNESLVKLNIRSNHISSEGCEGLIDALGKSSRCVPTRSKLQALYLSENEIGDEGAAFLGNMLRHNNQLEVLELDACYLSDKGIAALVKGLAYNSKLTELNLSNNTLKQDAAKSISDMLSINKSLKSLYLSSCHINNNTLHTLVSSIKNGENKSLKELWLSFNSFDNDGVFYLSEMIQQRNCQLSTLGIQFNTFDATGLQYIVSALEMNTSIQDIYIWNGSPCTETGSALLKQMDYWLGLNQAGRRAVIECSANLSLWPKILARADKLNDATGNPPDALFHFLCEVPSITTTALHETRCEI